MNSELLEISLSKHVPDEYKPTLLRQMLLSVYTSSTNEIEYFDEQDYNRIEYLCRKHPFPASILHIMSEGHVEDFFGSWCDSESREGVYDPDVNWQVLFAVP